MADTNIYAMDQATSGQPTTTGHTLSFVTPIDDNMAAAQAPFVTTQIPFTYPYPYTPTAAPPLPPTPVDAWSGNAGGNVNVKISNWAGSNQELRARAETYGRVRSVTAQWDSNHRSRHGFVQYVSSDSADACIADPSGAFGEPHPREASHHKSGAPPNAEIYVDGLPPAALDNPGCINDALRLALGDDADRFTIMKTTPLQNRKSCVVEFSPVLESLQLERLRDIREIRVFQHQPHSVELFVKYNELPSGSQERRPRRAPGNQQGRSIGSRPPGGQGGAGALRLPQHSQGRGVYAAPPPRHNHNHHAVVVGQPTHAAPPLTFSTPEQLHHHHHHYPSVYSPITSTTSTSHLHHHHHQQHMLFAPHRLAPPAAGWAYSPVPLLPHNTDSLQHHHHHHHQVALHMTAAADVGGGGGFPSQDPSFASKVHPSLLPAHMPTLPPPQPVYPSPLHHHHHHQDHPTAQQHAYVFATVDPNHYSNHHQAFQPSPPHLAHHHHQQQFH